MNTHFLPIGDLIEHASTEDCVCGPAIVDASRIKGLEYMGDAAHDITYLIVHRSLDGREFEPDGVPRSAQ